MPAVITEEGIDIDVIIYLARLPKITCRWSPPRRVRNFSAS
jgi:hypothetical protein